MLNLVLPLLRRYGKVWSEVPETKWLEEAFQLYALSLSIPMAILRFTLPMAARTSFSTVIPRLAPAITVAAAAKIR